MSALPLSWLLSVWKNFPEFWITENIWNQRTKEVNSEFGYFDKVPIPRGPYSCDRYYQQITERKDFFNKKKKVETTVTSSSKCVYMTKSSFHNQVAIGSSLTSLHSSWPMPSHAEDVSRHTIVKQENTKIINVRELPRSVSHNVSIISPGAPTTAPTEQTGGVEPGGELPGQRHQGCQAAVPVYSLQGCHRPGREASLPEGPRLPQLLERASRQPPYSSNSLS